MIFIAVKMRVLPEYADNWPELVGDYTRATRAETGCLWFEWSRSVLHDLHEYVLIEAFRDEQAGGAHVGSEHFKRAIAAMPAQLAETPRLINVSIPQNDWSLMGEMQVPERSAGGG